MMRILYHCLAVLSDRPLADAIVGDLEEMRHARRGIWRTAFGILLHLVGVRLRESLSAARQSNGGTRGSGGDLRQAFRTLRRAPMFAALAILLLALGIGANTAVFSVVDAVLLRPLPYHEPERLVFIWSGTHTNPGNTHGVLTGNHTALIASSTTAFESFAAVKSWDIGALDGKVDLVGPGGAERLRGALVTPNFFELLGVQARIGRTFASSDTGALPLVVLSDALWRRRFGADPAIVGQEIPVAVGRRSRAEPAYTVVGVLPPDVQFTYPRGTEIYVLHPWTSIAVSTSSNPFGGRSLEYSVVARLKGDATVDQAQAELTAATATLLRSYGFSEEMLKKQLPKDTMVPEPMTVHLQAEVRPGVLILAAVSALVLLIACVNLGLLLLARTVDRTGELAIRAAMGAGPRRIVRLLLTEGAVLALVGGAAGVLAAYLAMPLLRWIMPPIVPRMAEVSVNETVLLFAAAATTVTALVGGLAPAWVVMRYDLLSIVRRAAVTATADSTLALSRRIVTAVQVAVVVVLLVGAGLLLHSFWRLQTEDLGFEADGVITMEMRLLNPKYRKKGAVAAFQDQLLTEVRKIPGVAQASLTTAVPMRGVDFLEVTGVKNGKPLAGNWRSVDPEYFDVLGIPIVSGRGLLATDTSGAPRVMVASESFARQHFGTENAIGRRVPVGREQLEIVGIARDVRYAEVVRTPAPAFYLPRAQSPTELTCLLVRPQPGMNAAVSAALRDAVRAVDPEQPVEGLTTVDAIVTESTADRRFYALATSAFAGIALLLAIGGLFGVVSRSVSERRREIAIRAALGADPAAITRLVVAYGLIPVIAGLVVGVGAAMWSTGALTKLLYQVPPTDVLTYGVTVVIVLLVATAACLVPARRALAMPAAPLLRGD